MLTLAPHPDNSRYFRDLSGRPVYLTGSHHWDSLVDNDERPGGLDFAGYLDRLEEWGHNFIRLWTTWAWVYGVRPLPYLRSGPGLGRDGHPKFDLERFDPQYFVRLRQRVEAAGDRRMFVSVMLFQGWSLHDNGAGNPWFRHPYHRDNNINGIDGDPGGYEEGVRVHSLRYREIVRLQEAYVEEVVATVNEFDNVLYEIANESPWSSRDWQNHMMAYLRRVESALPKQHPVGMTSLYPGGRNSDLENSAADWISLGPAIGLRRRIPTADGRKVSILDTDHLFGIGGDAAWVWKSFLRGHNPIYMDPLDDDPVRAGARTAMGASRCYSEILPLERMLPDARVASSGYCLADRTPGGERFLVWVPSGKVRVDLRRVEGSLAAEWLTAETARAQSAPPVAGGARRTLRAPFAGDGVLYLSAVAAG